MYIKLTNGTPTKYTIGQLRRDNPKTSFPKQVSDEILAGFDVYPCITQDVGNINYDTHEIVNGNIEQVKGVWTQLRSTQQRPSDDVAKVMRRKRDSLIAETDYLALSDNTLTEAMATYRQALRDITDHANFPYLTEDDWPVKP
jgi:hypothetical protein